MEVLFVVNDSVELEGQIDIIYDFEDQFEDYFKDKYYGDDLQSLLIGLVCNSPKFAKYQEKTKPQYQREGKMEFVRGVQKLNGFRRLSYDIILDYSRYYRTEQTAVKKYLASDILTSLNVITTAKQVNDFELDRFRKDLTILFEEIGWI